MVSTVSRVAMAQLVCLIGKLISPFCTVGVLAMLGPTMEISFLGASSSLRVGQEHSTKFIDLRLDMGYPWSTSLPPPKHTQMTHAER